MEDKTEFIQYLLPDFNSKDLKLEFCGYHKCEKNHSFGPAVRDSYLLHFCLDGKGVFIDKNGVSRVNKGEFFIIKPREITTYTADKREPWEYVWIAFSGSETTIFNTKSVVYPISKDLILELKNLVVSKSINVALFKSIIYRIIHLVSNENYSELDLATKIKRYITFNYMEDLSLENLSRVFGYERTYLYRIFKSNSNISIKKYITNVRMEKAKAFLENGYSVSETSRLVGYNDAFNFSKAYKNFYGVAPVNIFKNSKSN